MPYYVFKVRAGPIRPPERIAEFPRFPEASRFAKQARARLAPDESCTIRVVFGETELAAEAAIANPGERSPRIADDL